LTRKIARKSRILQMEEMKLKLFEKNGKNKENGHYLYQKWFLDKAKLYTVVNEELSKKVSDNINAKIKECYHNCWNAVNTFPDLEYCEGYSFSEDLPIAIEHSWLLNSGGKVIDPTLVINGKKLQTQLKKYGADPPIDRERRIGSEYLGIKYTLKQLNRFALKTKKTGSFLYLLYKEENG